MSNKTPLIGDASGGKAATFGSNFAAYNSQVETNFNANDRPQSKISFDSDAPVSSLKQHSAYFFSVRMPQPSIPNLFRDCWTSLPIAIRASPTKQLAGEKTDYSLSTT